MLYSAILTAAALVSSAVAIQVTAPTNTTGWKTDGSEEIQWDSVSTDPSQVTIQLYTPSSPNTPITLVSNYSTSVGSYIYTPSSSLTAGDGYRINLVSTDAGILAQSNLFTVESGTSDVQATSSSSSSSGSSTSSASSTGSTSAGSSTTGSATGSQTSSATSQSASSSSGAGYHTAVPGGALMALAVALGVFA